MHDKRRTALAARLVVLSLSSCSLAGQRRRPERPRRRPPRVRATHAARAAAKPTAAAVDILRYCPFQVDAVPV